ncbi:MAG: hypothetical protein ABIR73_16575, partial [Usitatibacter sp.]
EVAGQAALLLPATDAEAWAQAMLRLTREPELRDHLRSLAPAQAARFDRAASAARLLELYAEALESPKRTPVTAVYA